MYVTIIMTSNVIFITHCHIFFAFGAVRGSKKKFKRHFTLQKCLITPILALERCHVMMLCYCDIQYAFLTMAYSTNTPTISKFHSIQKENSPVELDCYHGF